MHSVNYIAVHAFKNDTQVYYSKYAISSTNITKFHFKNESIFLMVQPIKNRTFGLVFRPHLKLHRSPRENTVTILKLDLSSARRPAVP